MIHEGRFVRCLLRRAWRVAAELESEIRRGSPGSGGIPASILFSLLPLICPRSSVSYSFNFSVGLCPTNTVLSQEFLGRDFFPKVRCKCRATGENCKFELSVPSRQPKVVVESRMWRANSTRGGL